MSTRRVLVLVAALAALVAADVAFGPRDEDPRASARSSSTSVRPEGTAALARLLEQDGRRVRRLGAPLDEREPDRRWTLFVLDPGRIASGEQAALVRFVRSGGRLVAAGAGTAGLARALGAGGPDAAFAAAARTLRPAAPAPELAAVRAIHVPPGPAWMDGGGGLPLLADADGPGLVGVAAGRGRALLLPDPGPLHNRALARADNAALGLALAGGPRTAAFLELPPDAVRATGLAALPARWKVALGAAVLAALVLLAARARRLGAAERPGRELAPPRTAYVEALAAGLARTPDRAALAGPVRDAARAALARRAGLAPDAPPDAVRDAAARLGLPPDEAAALASAGPPELLTAGRAHARLTTTGDQA